MAPSSATITFLPDEVAAVAEQLGVTDQVDLNQLRIGMEVELEHGRRDSLTNVTDDDPLLTAKIALAHLRELPDYYTRLAVMEAAGEGRLLRVRDLMSLQPVTVRDNTPLTVADRLMREHKVSGLPVVDNDGGLVGVISRTDVMAAASGPESSAWQGISVAATMTAPGLTVAADVALADAAARMEEHHVHRLVVVDPVGGHPIGILSTTDLVRAIAAGKGGYAMATTKARSTMSAPPPSEHAQRPIELILLRQLASYLDMPTFLVDRDGRLVYYNEPAEPLLGVRFEDVGSMEMADWLAAFRPSDQAGVPLPADEVPLVVALRERRPVHRELSISGLDGIRRRIGATALPLSGQGASFIGAVAIFWPESGA